MRAIPIGQYGETKFAFAVSQQKRCISRHTAAVRDIVIAIAYLGPPRQAEARSLVAPYVFDGSLELIVLPREHLIQSRLTDESFVFERAAIQIRNQPVRLIEHCRTRCPQAIPTLSAVRFPSGFPFCRQPHKELKAVLPCQAAARTRCWSSRAE